MEPKTRPHGGRHYRRQEKKPNVVTMAEFQEMKAWPLEHKINHTWAVIAQALDRMERPCVAFSGGKDSTVLLWFLTQVRPDIITIFGNTTIEFPECIKFARQLAIDWHLNYHEAKPEVTFWWVVEQYGWPLMGKCYGVGGVAHKSSREQFFADRLGDWGLAEFASFKKRDRQYAVQATVGSSSACCWYLKERPSTMLQAKLGVDGVFLGILASESRRRMFNFLQYGDLYRPADQKVWKCHPLSIWTDDDIWALIRKVNISYAPLYDMGFHHEVTGEWISHKRNGCMFCGMDIGFPNNHLAIMRRTHPAAWRTVMIHKGLGKVLLKLRLALDNFQMDMFESTMGVSDYLDRFPCAFDRV